MTMTPQHPGRETDVVLDELFRHTPVGVVLCDLHCAIRDVNEALCAMIGYDRADVIGHNLGEFLHPGDVDAMVKQRAELRDGRIGSYVANRRFLTRGGEVVYTRVSVSMVHSAQRVPTCVVAFVENVTETVKMDAALRQSELRYRRVVDDQPDLIVRSLPDGTRTFVNEAYCRWHDAPASALLGESFFARLNEDEQRIMREKFARLSPSTPVITAQHWVLGPGGERYWYEWTDRGFFDEHGRLLEVQSVGRDITEQYEAREKLVESEERYRRLFTSLPVAVWENDWSEVAGELARRGLTSPEAMVAAVAEDPALYSELGTTVRITTVNPAALEMAGVSTLPEFDAWLARAATPQTALRFSQIVPALLFGDRTYAFDEYTLIRADGKPIDVLIRVARSPRWGERQTMSTIAVDVTERRRIQRELEQKQELTERAERAAHYGSWEWNAGDNVMFGSAEFWRILDGRDDGGPNQRPLEECVERVVTEDRAGVTTWWDELREPSTDPRPREFTGEYRVQRPDGSIAVVRSQRFVTYREDGSMIRAFGILHDITLAKRAEEEAARHRDELLRADKMIALGILVSGMAHEINNPNHTIGLNAPLVRDAWRDAASLLDELAAKREVRIGRLPWSEARGEVAAMIEDIALASDRIRNIVTELRAYALDQEPGELRPVSVNDVVQSSMRLLGRHIARATKHFSLNLADDLPPVAANANRLEQVVVNLVINACQALLHDEQAIEVQTGTEEGRVFIRVRDEGRGMTPEQLATIRTPFFTTRRATGGTGLGVPVADRIAREHGGSLTFDSKPGHGMIATLWLPAVKK